MKTPTLETERFILRPMMISDWPDYYDLMQSERSTYMGGPMSKTAAWGMFCHDVALWDLMGHGALMIEDRQSGTCLGQVGINHGPLFPEPEIGWFLYPNAEGRGVAFEAAKTLLDWSIGERGLKSLVSYIDRDNVRSCKLAQRLGAKIDPDAPRPNPEDLVYRHMN